MFKFSHDVVEKLGLMDSMEKIAVESPSAQASADAQVANVKAAHLFYEVLQKKAEEVFVGESHERFCGLVEKIAECTGKETPPVHIQVKIAAAVLVDDMLTAQLSKEDTEKVATTRAYGREFITALLQEALA